MAKLDLQKPTDLGILRQVARLWGISPSYLSASKVLTWVEGAALRGVLEGISGEEVFTQSALFHVREKLLAQHARDMIEPVVVAWDGDLAQLRLTTPRQTTGLSFTIKIMAEDGDTALFTQHVSLDAQTRRGRQHLPEPFAYEGHVVPLGVRLPLGYHRLSISSKSFQHTSLVIAAPRSLEQAPMQAKAAGSERRWGLFTPVYALRSDDDWGMGSFRELAETAKFVSRQGGHFVGTLPLLPLDDPRSPSPYAPSSRLFWNECYLDAERLVRESGDSALLQLIKSQHFLVQKHTLQDSQVVRYEQVAKLKELLLTPLAKQFFAAGGQDTPAFRRFTKTSPELSAYAQFKASLDPTRQRYHEYVQFQAFCALEELSKTAPGVGLYLDFPVGVAASGFDSRYFRQQFLQGFSVGAPPDAFFPKGQNWGFQALDPRHSRLRHHEYWIKALRHHMRFAQVLRIDHVMGLHRLYVIPHGSETSQGAYIRMNAEEVYAILCLEGRRHACTVVGEDLGTVPRGVPRAMQEHGVARMWVFQYEAEGGAPAERIAAIPSHSMASVNTHDMPPFRGYWQTDDLSLNESLGLAAPDYIAGLRAGRQRALAAWRDYLQAPLPSTAGPSDQLLALPWPTSKDDKAQAMDDAGGLRAPAVQASSPLLLSLIRTLSASPAAMLLLNLEDLWGEQAPQNVPGTSDSYPNWQKKHRLPMATWQGDQGIASLLAEIATARQGPRPQPKLPQEAKPKPPYEHSPCKADHEDRV